MVLSLTVTAYTKLSQSVGKQRNTVIPSLSYLDLIYRNHMNTLNSWIISLKLRLNKLIWCNWCYWYYWKIHLPNKHHITNALYQVKWVLGWCCTSIPDVIHMAGFWLLIQHLNLYSLFLFSSLKFYILCMAKLWSDAE